MTTIAELVDAEPEPTRGIATTLPGTAGVWRWVIELADPSAGTDVEWFDVTTDITGVEYTRGADQPFGRYRASVANLEFKADDDTWAPWNPDTSPTFGVHVELGPGLLIRGGFIRVVSAAVAEWNPRFTLKVERWGDASQARGNIRLHRVLARDTMTALVAVPIPASLEEDWSDRAQYIIDQAGWVYGSEIHGDAALTVPDRDAQTSAVQELDATLDPAGCVWFTDRKGRLIITNSWIDTFHSDPGLYWGDVDPVTFTYYAEDDPGLLGHVAYAWSDGYDSVGIERSEEAIVNHVVRVAPGGTFDDDDPVSIQRFDRKTSTQSWIVENDTVAQDILDAGAFREYQARPIFTSRDLHGFLPAAGSRLDYLYITAIDYSTQIGRGAAAASGVCRQYVERITPRGDNDVSWEITTIIDVFANQLSAGAALLPVEDLALEAVSDVDAEFSWTNPTQLIDPTGTQIRMLNPASLWADAAYPITGVVWGGLDPDTAYEFQVRLIREVLGVVTHFSPSRSYNFTTASTTIPVFDGEDTEFPDPDTGCTLEWELQSSPDGVTWSTEDSGTITTPPFTLDDYDTSGLDAELFYRFRSREMCPGAGPWVYGDVFVIDCLPVVTLLDPPFDDAIAYWPQICPPNNVTEAVSEEEALGGPGWGGVGHDGDGLPVLLSSIEGTVIYGLEPPAVAGWTQESTITCRVMLGAQPSDVPLGNELMLFGIVGLQITASKHGAGYKVHGIANEAGSGFSEISGPTELALNTEYNLALTHDHTSGDLYLYINGVEEAHSASVGIRNDHGFFGMVLPADSWITDCAFWDHVLAAGTLPGTPDLTVTINKGSGQADPTAGSSISFDVVFSEAVTGFATGDVTLSGTAGATTATVTDTGDHIHFTVAVTGMSASGTVIASIAANKCVSTATGASNLASTSTDNNVQYNLPVTVTINQGSGQADPTTGTPIVFDVVFSEAVTGFATGDVTLSGTAGATTATVTGSGTTYTVSVSGMTSAGTVIATIGAAVCTSVATGQANSASTSSDNTVTLSALTVTINQGSGQADPTTSSPIVFDVVFSVAVTGFATGDVTLSGTAGATTATVSGSGTTYTVSVTGMTGSGTVIATIGAGVCTATGTGIPNAASTSTDNTVTYSAIAMRDYCLTCQGGTSYPNDKNMTAVNGEFLLIASAYRASGAGSPGTPTVSPGTLGTVTSIKADANFDTAGTSRGTARLDRSTAGASGTMAPSPASGVIELIMAWTGLSGAPVQSARSTADANDSCNLSLGSAPSGTVIAIIMYGGTGITANAHNTISAPSGWTRKVHDEGINGAQTKGVLVFQANTPQQTLTFSLPAGYTTAGGRDVHLLEY